MSPSNRRERRPTAATKRLQRGAGWAAAVLIVPNEFCGDETRSGTINSECAREPGSSARSMAGW